MSTFCRLGLRVPQDTPIAQTQRSSLGLVN